jgi:ribosomal protein L21E
MNVGDNVRLKNNSFNKKTGYLARYRGRIGKVIDVQVLRTGKTFVRVIFENTKFYEDLLARRLEKI